MSSQAAIFIGSSLENLDYANALQSVLDHDFEPTVWTYGVFMPGGDTLASLITRAQITDFAALFLTPDDKSEVRGEYLVTPRDNLVFELGLFIGQLGPDRVFLLTPRDGVDLPTDLQGVTPIKYRTDREDDDMQNAVNPAATEIRNAIRRRKLGPRPGSGGCPSVRRPSIEALTAIGRLGGVAAKNGAVIEIRPVAGGRVEIGLLDATRLGTSVEVDLGDVEAVRAIGRLGDTVRSG
jgi:predicted nucleotide-binding protein with TIR-like domain